MERILCSLLVATLPFGSVLAGERQGALVYLHELLDKLGSDERTHLASQL
jgi:hypothetical protein